MNVKDKNYDEWEELSISNDFLFGKIMQDYCDMPGFAYAG